MVVGSSRTTPDRRSEAAKAAMNKLSAPDAVKEEMPPGCEQCFPDGWPEEATSVGCEHGTWTRYITTNPPT